MELTLASYNIHGGVGTDGRFDLQRVVEVLREINPDIAALQEVGNFQNHTTAMQTPEDLPRLLGMRMAFGPNVVSEGRRYGNAILTRLPVLRFRNYDLSVARREPRGALRCDLDLGEGRPLHVFCLHLGLAPRERRAQESLLLSADILRDAVRKDPVVVCGDFNYWGNRPVTPLVRQAIHDAALLMGSPERTYHSRFPFFRLDRIYVDAGIHPFSVRRHRSKLAVEASDHLPLVMRFAAPPSGGRAVSAPVQLIN
jgi:endonuclease/exonuclease/phosphatase family metal-dependent hydrolase